MPNEQSAYSQIRALMRQLPKEEQRHLWIALSEFATTEDLVTLLLHLSEAERHQVLGRVTEKFLEPFGGWATPDENMLMEQFKKETRLLRSYGNCTAEKKAQVARRNEIIQKEALSAGITEPEEILKFLIENHPDLVRKGRGYIKNSKKMMEHFRESRKERP